MSSSQPEDGDSTKREQRQQRMRRVPIALAPFAACMGLVAFASVAGNPRFETFHTLDVIRLMTAGVGFCVALVVLIQFFNFPSPPSEAKKEKGPGGTIAYQLHLTATAPSAFAKGPGK